MDIKQKIIAGEPVLVPPSSIDYNPHTNHDVISIIRQEDGNYIGECFKFGKMIEVREVGPETVLQKLLTHDGASH